MYGRRAAGRPRMGVNLQPSSQKVYDRLHSRTQLTPRVAHAARLYASGAMPTKKAAALAVGLKPTTLYATTGRASGSPLAQSLMEDVQTQVHERAIDVGALLHRLSVEAISTIDHVRRNGTTEDIRLKAAIDLADRGPQTSKVQKMQVESFTLAGKDVDAIRQAMAESVRVQQLHADVTGDFEQLGAMEDLHDDSRRLASGD